MLTYLVIVVVFFARLNMIRIQFRWEEDDRVACAWEVVGFRFNEYRIFSKTVPNSKICGL